jgi:hypothetical protein
VLVGAAAFAAALAGGATVRAWQAFHVNFLFWRGLAFAGVVISAILRLTESRWGWTVRRLGECSAALLPLVLLLQLGIVAGWGTLGPELGDVARAKQLWLAPSSLLLRDGVALLLLVALALAYVYFSLRPDLGAAKEAGKAAGPLADRLTRGWRGAAAEAARARRITGVLAPLLVLGYCLGFTLFGIDQVMGLDPTWTSTLFGAYFFITSLYLGWAALAAAAALVRLRGFRELGPAMDDDVLHSLGKLLFAFCFLALDFFWSQFLVIWYGNLPEETPFVLRRVREQPWADVAFTVLLFCFLVPFVALLFKRIKRDPRTLLIVSLLVAGAMWLERFLLVVPSVWQGGGLPLGFLELGVTAGFCGAAGLCYLWLLRRVPLLPAPEVLAAQAADAVDEEAHG